MKKLKPNRMKKKNRKMIRHTEAFRRRMETQKNQREALKNGLTFHPRCLARSVGVFVGQITDEISAKNAAFNWKVYMEAVINHPHEFRSMLNPVKPKRVIRKVEK